MSKFDLNLKIDPQDLWQDIFEKNRLEPHQFLQKKLKFSPGLKPNYFNWGRNALYYLFKSLPFTTITFPAFTCPTLTQAAQKAGKKVVLVEIDPNTFNLDIEKIPSQTKCLVAVHTFGNPVDIKKIRRRLGSQVFIIEDCAHALFAKLKNKYVGSQGQVILFSLYKQIANINGSLLMYQNKLLEQQAEEGVLKHALRILFKTQGFHQSLLDFKRGRYLPSIGRQKLNNFKPSHLVFYLFAKGFAVLQKEISGRQKILKYYQKHSAQSEFFIPQQAAEKSQPSCYQFAIKLQPQLAPFRDKIVLDLRKQGIIIDRLWFQAPIAQAKYKSFQKKCPQALTLAQTIINLPIDADYSPQEVSYLFEKLNQVIIQYVKA